jgi:hypothetical protein
MGYVCVLVVESKSIHSHMEKSMYKNGLAHYAKARHPFLDLVRCYWLVYPCTVGWTQEGP